VFEDDIVSVYFTFVCNVASSMQAAVIPLSFVVNGTEASLVNPNVESDDISISPSMYELATILKILPVHR
jgi:hypothetical protein